MRITISLPDPLISRFLYLCRTENAQRSLSDSLNKLMQRESALEQAYLAANAEAALADEIKAWEGFDENSEESSAL